MKPEWMFWALKTGQALEFTLELFIFLRLHECPQRHIQPPRFDLK